MTDTKIEVVNLPPETSMRGDNTHVVKCEGVGRHSHYAVCLFFLKKLEDGKLEDGSFEDCVRAGKNKQCDALTMRAEEREAGKALYYEQREASDTVSPKDTRPRPDYSMKRSQFKESNNVRQIDKSSDSYKRGWNQVQGTRTRDIPIPTSAEMAKPIRPKPRPADEMVQMNAAELVNAVAKDEQNKPKETAKPLPGETPLDFIKRTKGK